MKLKSVLVFGIVIVLLPLVAKADPDVKEYNLKFKGEGQFEITFVGFVDGVPLLSFSPPVDSTC